ncbi:MAG TPA: FtsX-like permease family protein [Thermoanaerobaculia bacterium]|jgi:putative ABC transport system permease protein|nr:FtsX-like permease family protein [Thermoanaerobaculia bacterium]
MTRHLFKLVWNRKRTNALIILEIFFSFLVVCLVATMGVYFWDNYRRPLGFSYQDVWKIVVDTNAAEKESEAMAAGRLKTFARLLREVQALEPVEAAAGSLISPYDQGGWTSNMEIEGKPVEMDANVATVGLADVLKLELVAGRWFEEADEARAWTPTVIDQDLAREAYGDENPIGRQFGGGGRGSEKPNRVVGVVREFRKGGEFSAQGNFMFQFLSLEKPSFFQPQVMLVRLRPGTPAAFEEDLVRLLQGVAPEWSFQVQPLTQARESTFRLFLTPLVAGGIVAFFLLLMVGLGLIGVLWQNLLQRTRELGLRRAAGASRSAIHRQVLWEQAILTSLGVLLGVLVVVQIPILDLIGFIRPEVFAAGLGVSMAAIYLLAVLCALYPSAMASRLQPAEALRYE